FLDKEHLGLSDGEGWKVRRWATERLEGNSTGAAATGSESDDEKGDSEKRPRSVSPLMHYKPTAPETHASREQQPPKHASPTKNTSTPAIPQNPPQAPTSAPVSNPTMPPMFHFRSPHPSQDTDMTSSDISPASDPPQPDIISVPPIPTPPPTVRLEVLPRGPRTPHRHTNSHPSRHNTRSSTANTSKRSLGLGAGSKRRIDPSDYFPDLDGRDGFGGGGGGAKRGRWE
ncbi:MAG: hypothetical protein Q9183_006771, partial [Haloplaca sp. 2 TL-2023]